VGHVPTFCFLALVFGDSTSRASHSERQRYGGIEKGRSHDGNAGASRQRRGFELWGIEFFQQGRHSVLRLFIDGPDGVSVEGCAQVSHQVSGVLDVEDPIAGEYTLEVSSPGWDRPLFTLAQYGRFVGDEVAVRLASPLNSRRKYKGVVQQITDDAVQLLCDGVEVSIPFAMIDKGNVVPNF
jgi:ribosome maturation factor RimP